MSQAHNPVNTDLRPFPPLRLGSALGVGREVAQVGS